jgi:hypothetical protein
LFDNSIWMLGRFVVMGGFAIGEAFDAEIVVMAGTVGASYPDLLQVRTRCVVAESTGNLQ